VPAKTIAKRKTKNSVNFYKAHWSYRRATIYPWSTSNHWI